MVATAQPAARDRTSGSPDQRPMIEAIGLSKHYGTFAATDNVNFSLHRGEVVAFLGPNGAGKSTTMKLLTGYLSPTAGTARIAGHDMATERLAGSAQLGYLPENGPLYPDMTPYESLCFFADARGLDGTYRTDRIGAVIELCDLEEVRNKPIRQLSKGFRQRCGVAQALLHEPEVLILDEPTAGLDPNQIYEMRETLVRLGREKTILLSTHIMQEVAAICQRVILINEGRLIYDGPAPDMAHRNESIDEAFRRLTHGATERNRA